MIIPTSILALAQLLASSLTPQSQIHAPSSSLASQLISYLPRTSPPSSSLGASWIGDLPPGTPGTTDPESNIRLGASVSSCTFVLGPPGPPASALCPAFISFCTSFKDDLRSKRISQLKTSPPLSHNTKRGDDDDSNPLKDIKFRTGCVGGSGLANDGSFLSGYTATCIFDGTDWIPFVFDSFIQAEFSTGDQNAPLPIYSSFIGCQVPAHV
ncbi:uncharacterized protein UBRO_01705 [Ustilago bromivora]|uniref:Uncharacterized protein n=1 Tax=Ustilago bromivora TaxID=307758 RepID=A0A1K0GL49_9BASI|nr:uncharacterized protein UBRO_01705 [Ustilago bromivora]SYW78171.1 uncharacterized protein UBRO2_02363 [Ustilago bromivora]